MSGMEKDPTTRELMDALLDFQSGVTSRFDLIDRRFDRVDAKLLEHDRQFEAIDLRFAAMDRRFEAVEFHLSSLDRRVGHIETRVEDLERRLPAL